jgi:hypothetical protein
LGNGHHIENVIQAAGRATFIGSNLLQENGHSHVTMLTASGDWDMIKAHQKYVVEVYKRHGLGENILEAMQGTAEKLPGVANYLRFNNRRTGLRRKSGPNSFYNLHNPSFAATMNLSEGEKDGKVAFYSRESNNQLRLVAETCFKLLEDKSLEFDAQEITKEYNKLYWKIPPPIMKSTVTKCLKQLVKDLLITEKPCENKNFKH